MDKLVTHFQRMDRIHDPLYVICTIFNPLRFRVRWKHYQDFIKRVREAHAIPVIVEIAFGDRDFVTPDCIQDGDIYLHLRTKDPLWLKENSINLAVQHLPQNWNYVAWVDTDVTFLRDDWADEAIHCLQHYEIIQMFSEAHTLNSNHELLESYKGFAYCYRTGLWKGDTNVSTPINAKLASYPDPYLAKIAGQEKGVYLHPGFCWGATKKAWNTFGGLIDFAILGAADYHQAYGLINRMDITLGWQKGYSKPYVDGLYHWQERACRLEQRLGYMEGAVVHHWHGSTLNRKYNERYKVLVDNKFNPLTDIFRDSQGLYQLSPNTTKLRHALHDYMSIRNEDSPI